MNLNQVNHEWQMLLAGLVWTEACYLSSRLRTAAAAAAMQEACLPVSWVDVQCAPTRPVEKGRHLLALDKGTELAHGGQVPVIGRALAPVGSLKL